MIYPSSRKAGWISLAASAAMVSALAAPAMADDPTPAAKLAPVAAHQPLTNWQKKLPTDFKKADGSKAYFVQLDTVGAAAAAARSGERAVPNARAKTKDLSSKVLSAAKGQDSNAARLYTVSNAVPGIGIRTNAAGLKAIAKRADVTKIKRIVPKRATNANTAQLVRAIDTWRNTTRDTGAGVRIGIIDTGIDYTHADFGGVGTAAAYEAEDSTSADWLDNLPAKAKAKFAGGHDFVGDDYNADPSSADFQPIPHPDSNPLDCNEHGTHVAGSAAGYGVGGKGKTYTGGYTGLTDKTLSKFQIGPGMAPQAKLYGLKVFGCEGSTDEVIPALDWALDPNGDGDFSDHLDMINMSLGSDYGVVDDPENDVINELSKHGVLSVISMGNNGDLTDTGGSPGNAEASLAVASSVDSMQLRDGLKVNAPSTVADTYGGQMSVAYDWANNGPTRQPVTGTVAAIPGDNADGCEPFSDADAALVKGKVAWLEWDDSDATRRCGSAGRAANAREAGAIGAIFTSGLNVFGAGITGDAQIPVIQLPKSATEKLSSAAAAGTLNVTFDGALRGAIKDNTPAISDTLSNFSSRGPHGSLGVVKPDVAAPGDTITSAGVGTGNGQLTISGTSMAAPVTTGIAALVKKRHPNWTPGQIKAAVMNTAGNDVWTGTNKSGNRFGPARVGAGRVDAYRAATTKYLAYVAGENNPVSASFGPVEAPADVATVTKTRKVTIENTSPTAKRFTLGYDARVRQPGVSYSVSPRSLTVGGNKSRTATVTMTIDTAALRHSIDPSMPKTQLGAPRQYVADASGNMTVTPAGLKALRVPVYGAAKPVSATTAAAAAGQITLTGKGFDQGSGSTAFQSFTSVLELGAQSGQLPVCTSVESRGCVSGASDQAGDLKYIGAGSTSDWLWFGIATHGNWATVGNSVIPYVDYDVNGDGQADYETYLQNVPSTDLLYAQTVDLNDFDPTTGGPRVVDAEPINFNDGNVDTNVFDSNVALLPVWKGAIGLDQGGSKPISYTVGTFSAFTGSDIDTASATYDAGTPDLAVAGPLFHDQGGASIDYTAAKAVKALVIHLHGASGHREEVLDLAATSAQPAPEAPSSGAAESGSDDAAQAPATTPGG